MVGPLSWRCLTEELVGVGRCSAHLQGRRCHPTDESPCGWCSNYPGRRVSVMRNVTHDRDTVTRCRRRHVAPAPRSSVTDWRRRAACTNARGRQWWLPWLISVAPVVRERCQSFALSLSQRKWAKRTYLSAPSRAPAWRDTWVISPPTPPPTQLAALAPTGQSSCESPSCPRPVATLLIPALGERVTSLVRQRFSAGKILP